jgi:hypothetical protein
MPGLASRLRGRILDGQNRIDQRAIRKVRKATGYVTIAERTPRAENFPAHHPRISSPGQSSSAPPTEPVPLDNFIAGGDYVKGADWRHPSGPASDLEGKEKTSGCADRLR